MIWFIPIAAATVYAAKKIYDAVSDDSDSSSYSYSDNSAQRESEAKEDQARKDRQNRKERLTKQLTSMAQTMLDSVSKQYLSQPLTLKTTEMNAIESFSAAKVGNLGEAKATLGILATGTFNVDPVADQKEHQDVKARIAGLEQLEKLL